MSLLLIFGNGNRIGAILRKSHHLHVGIPFASFGKIRERALKTYVVAVFAPHNPFFNKHG